nr:long-chain-fatty-acid--CoA ligase [Sphingomonas sp. CDS-1]
MLLHEPFDFHARSRAGYVLSKSDGTALTYGQGRERSLRMASMLIGLGLKPGERVATIMNNAIDALLLIYAAARTGIVCVPLNCRLAPREWMGMIDDAQARVVIADPAFGEALDNAGGKPPIAICSQSTRPGWLALDELLAVASRDIPRTSLSDEAPVLQLYTSGTTGKPKGAMISHRSILSDISLISFAIGNCFPGQRSLHLLPFFHVAGVGFALRAVSGGETLVILKSVDPAVLLKTLVDEEIAWTFIVPTIIQMLLKEPGIENLRFPHLRQILYGASPIAEHVLVKAMKIFGCDFLQGFGMTELSCAGTFLSEDDHARALVDRPDLLSSAGRALPGTELRIVDGHGADCPPGEIGEILIRGPQVFLGYWGLREATEAALRDGWLHSGDAGSLDEEGYLFIRDRIKDMIVSGGENVYPAEVEAVLHQHPQVAEVSVIGVPDDKWGETVMAVIVPEVGCELNEAELDSYCRAHLGGFKLPRRYSFVTALPRNASGKILKRDLRAGFWEGQARQIG